MSNSYYAPSGNNKAIPGNTVRSAQFNGNNDLVEQAFDLLPAPDDLITSRQNFVVSSGVVPNLYEITLPGITVLKDGMAIAFKAHKANTGPVSVKVNGTFTRTVKNSVRVQLLAGDLIVDTIALLRYDNTNGEFQMANAISNVADEVERARMYAANSLASSQASATSAGQSAVSAQQSAASASDASVSRASAAISAQSAAQSLTDIYARYLGSRTTYFTQRPDGSPLTGGELMFLAAAVNAGRGLYYYDLIDTSWKPSSDPQVATLVSALQTIMSQHIGVGGSLSHPNVTPTVTGFMSSDDKVKLDGVATNANNYVHPVGDGNSHVPATGTTNANKVLMAGDTPGSFGWQIPQVADIGGLNAALLTKMPLGGGTFTGPVEMAGPATLPNQPVTLDQFTKYGGLPLLFSWWEDNRASIPEGTAPRDGQELSRALFPDAWAAAQAKGIVITEAEWQADPLKRMRWSSGNGTTTFRIPDENGKSVGSVGAPVRRGDGAKSNGVTGTIQMDAIRNITGTGVLAGAKLPGSGVFTGAFKPLVVSNQISQASTVAGNVEGFSLDVSLAPGVLVADENRMLNATGCYVIKLAGGAFNEGQINALVLATEIAALTTRVTVLEGHQQSTYLYPGGSAAAPASLGLSQRIVLDNPFPGRKIDYRCEVQFGGIWGAAGYGSNVGSGTFSAGALAIPWGDSIVIWSGATYVLHVAAMTANSFPSATAMTAAPYRVCVWTID